MVTGKVRDEDRSRFQGILTWVVPRESPAWLRPVSAKRVPVDDLRQSAVNLVVGGKLAVVERLTQVRMARSTWRFGSGISGWIRTARLRSSGVPGGSPRSRRRLHCRVGPARAVAEDRLSRGRGDFYEPPICPKGCEALHSPLPVRPNPLAISSVGTLWIMRH